MYNINNDTALQKYSTTEAHGNKIPFLNWPSFFAPPYMLITGVVDYVLLTTRN